MNEKNQNANTKTICGTSRQALFNGDDLAEKQDDPGSVPPSGCGQDVLRDSRQRETAQDEERTTAGQQEQEEGRITRACRSAEEALKEIAALPSIPFAHRRHLPAASGVYFVLEQGQCAYVGQSLNIRQRWMSHHKIAKLREREGVTISWALVDATSLYDVEIYYINLLKPPMNVIYTDHPPDGSSGGTSVRLSDALRAKLIRLSEESRLTQAQIIEHALLSADAETIIKFHRLRGAQTKKTAPKK